MKYVSFLLVFAVSTVAFSQEGAPPKSKYTTDKQKVSYGIGLNIGRQMKADNLDVDPAVTVSYTHLTLPTKA